MLKLYHAEPVANSLKALISLKEKALPFESVYVDLHRFEQHDPAFLAINPEGQVPVLVHDGAVITHTTVIARAIEGGEFDKLMERIPLPRQREKWMKARAGFGEAELANATRKIEQAIDKIDGQLALTPWLAGDACTLADINFFAVGGLALHRLFPDLDVPHRAPRLTDWISRIAARPGVQAALAMPNRTDPRLRTFTGEAR